MIFRSVGQRSLLKVKPILYMLGKGGISVLQTAIFLYQVADLLCYEFITSKTFLLDFVNNRTYVNFKTFVGHLTHMAGKSDVITCALSRVTSQ